MCVTWEVTSPAHRDAIPVSSRLAAERRAATEQSTDYGIDWTELQGKGYIAEHSTVQSRQNYLPVSSSAGIAENVRRVTSDAANVFLLQICIRRIGARNLVLAELTSQLRLLLNNSYFDILKCFQKML